METESIKKLISKMSLNQKIGAMLTLGFSGTIVKPHIHEYITKYHCGGLRLSPEHRSFGNYTDPKTGKVIVNVERKTGYKKGVNAPNCTASEYKKILNELQDMALERPLGIPLHFSYDQEGGTSADFFFGGVNIFPKPMGLRATGDKKLAYEVAKAVSKQSKSVGFNWLHSPVLDINVDPRNPEIYTRAYSDRVEDVIEYSIESCKGYKEEKIIATGKHFPGRGDSPIDAHFQLPVIDVDKETMLERELLPYKILIEKGLLPSIMIAHSIFPALDEEDIATVSKKIITDLLRNELGFEGVITTDSMTMGAIATRYGVANACAMALEAGADLVLMKAENELVEETFNTIKMFVEQGRISEEELNKKVYRVLNLKYEYGLFQQSNYNNSKPEEIINDERIIKLSKQVARKSVLIARQQDDILPLSSEQNILIIEQMVKSYNSYTWHPGILYKNCLKYNKNLSYIETAYTYDEDDKTRIMEQVKEFDTIVITNYFIRGKLCNSEFINELSKDKSKKIIVVTNTPYEEISIPENVENVVITFATSPDNIEATAGVLFGDVNPEGEWPVEYQLKGRC
ncbi:glycoside hydrolase family 3 protein [Clostridium sp. DL1XJH146]